MQYRVITYARHSTHACPKKKWSCRHPAFYCFHQLNAFESGDDLIVDLAAYPDHSIMVQLHRTNMLFGLNPMDAAIPTRCKHAMTWIVWTGFPESETCNNYSHGHVCEMILYIHIRFPVVRAAWCHLLRFPCGLGPRCQQASGICSYEAMPLPYCTLQLLSCRNAFAINH